MLILKNNNKGGKIISEGILFFILIVFLKFWKSFFLFNGRMVLLLYFRMWLFV